MSSLVEHEKKKNKQPEHSIPTDELEEVDQLLEDASKIKQFGEVPPRFIPIVVKKPRSADEIHRDRFEDQDLGSGVIEQAEEIIRDIPIPDPEPRTAPETERPRPVRIPEPVHRVAPETERPVPVDGLNKLLTRVQDGARRVAPESERPGMALERLEPLRKLAREELQLASGLAVNELTASQGIFKPSQELLDILEGPIRLPDRAGTRVTVIARLKKAQRLAESRDVPAAAAEEAVSQQFLERQNEPTGSRTLRPIRRKNSLSPRLVQVGTGVAVAAGAAGAGGFIFNARRKMDQLLGAK